MWRPRCILGLLALGFGLALGRGSVNDGRCDGGGRLEGGDDLVEPVENLVAKRADHG
jgi:hypothetical protein